jgi:hypothetical protein
MNQDIKNKWIDALLSGEYKQGYSVLHNRDDNSYCVLGVLCEVARKCGVIETSSKVSYYAGETRGIIECTVYGEYSTFMLPPEVTKWANLNDSNPTIPSNDPVAFQPTLSSYNDKGCPFSKLANIIKESF